MNLIQKIAITGLGLLCVSTLAEAQTPGPERLFSFEKTLSVSPYRGVVGQLQARLNDELVKCGQRGVSVDYRAGRGTASGIQRLRTCPGFAIAGEEGREDLTVDLWKKLWPDQPTPNLGDRSWILTLTFEGTDYDRFLWNVGQAADPYAFGTWGPFGATIGASGEVQVIAKAFETAYPGALKAAFDKWDSAGTSRFPKTNWRDTYCATRSDAGADPSGSALLLSLSAPLSAADKEKLGTEFCSTGHEHWYGAFRILASDPRMIGAYNAHYSDQNRRIANRIAALYKERDLIPTEIDWAFFLDRGTQFTTSREAVRAVLAALPANATPSARRLAIARASLPTKDSHRKLRLGRDISFVVDDLSEVELTPEEQVAWMYYGSRRASQVGLSDARAVAENPF